jgi:hypothetical protein
LVPIINPGKNLKNDYKNITTLVKIEPPETGPQIYSYTTIKGKNLKIPENDEKAGIYYINNNGNKNKVKMYGKSKPSEQIFLAPENLVTGEYKLNICTKSGNLYKNMTHDKKLTAK